MDDRPSRPGWTLALASLGVFLTTLDVVVVATALPVMRVGLHADLADLEWTINAYNLVFACLIPTGAALGDRFGRRRAYVAGVGLFTAASAAAALSTTAGGLIAARIVQGAGAAVVLPLTLTLITAAFPAEKRGAAVGVWGGVTGLGVAAGPLVGGVVVQGVSWEWIFWLNVPVGLALMPLSALLLTESRGPRSRLDVPGLVLAGAGLFALTWGPVRAPSAGWGSAQVVGALAGGAVLMAAFVAWERRARQPMLPLRYFRDRGFATANGVAFFQRVSLIGSLFLIAQLFQTGMGYSPLQAGLRILVWTAMPMLVAPVAGVLADRFGFRPFMAAGLALQAAGLGWLAAVAAPDAGYGGLVLPLIVAGIGISLCFPTVAGLVVSAVPPDEAGVAAGTNSAVGEVAGVFGIALVAAVFAAHGGYGSPDRFLDGFVPAEWAAAGVSAAGVAVALLAPGRVRRAPAAAAEKEAVA